MNWMNPPLNSVNESLILVNESLNSVDESLILVNPPLNSVNESLILVNEPWGDSYALVGWGSWGLISNQADMI
ncbi:hypothetical protein [Nostoc sp.]|uniref:hypothetical protein n=1 Tax=Nostoc sp. TaxID=1180 RepID=UPI002FF7E982